MTGLVVDASALVALIGREPGADIAEGRLQQADDIYISIVNVAETASVLARRGSRAALAHRAVSALDWAVRPVEATMVERIGGLVVGDGPALSLGDRCCLALADALGVPVLTGDRPWLHVEAERFVAAGFQRPPRIVLFRH